MTVGTNLPKFSASNSIRQLVSAWYRLQFFMDFRSISRILRYRKLRRKYYDRFWHEAARNMGADFLSNPFGFNEIRKDSWSTYVKDYQMMFDSHLMLELMGNKGFTYRLLTELGAPVIPHVRFQISAQESANRFLQQHQKVVVKPASGTGGGRGVTTGITNIHQLKTAVRLAARFDRDLLMEKQVDGHSFRLLFLDGVFIDAIRRDPPVVHGDGKSTISQLIKNENKRRENSEPVRALSPLVIDRDAKNWMISRNMKLSAVPEVDEIVQVKCATNENDSSGNVNVTKYIGDEIVSQCSRLVNQIGVKFAGVDLICHDIAGSFSSENCFVGEINTTPGLHHHYLIANPEDGNPVAEIALRYLYENGLGISRSDQQKAQVNAPAMHLEQSEILNLPQEKEEA